MKGVIVKCLVEMVNEQFGADKWEAAREKAGIAKHAVFLAVQDVDDKTVLKVVECVCEVLGITLPQAADAFGEYWVNTFAPKIYSTYYSGVDNAKDFLLKMDKVHSKVTKSMAGAHPPHFEYEWENDKTLLMKYKSKRGLIDFLVGLAKGVGTYFKEDLQVSRLGDDQVRIVFR